MARTDRVEESLDRDFLLLISQAKTCFLQVTDDRHKALCTEWLSRLCSEPVQGVSPKRNRNVFLMQLLMNMQEGTLTGPFLSYPQSGALPSANQIFGFKEADETPPHEVDDPIENFEENFEEESGDGRTYVAIRPLPNNRGSYAFIALNVDKEVDDTGEIMVVPCSTDKSSLRHVKALHKLSTSGILDDAAESETKDGYIRNIEARVSGDITQLYEKLSSSKRTCGRNINEIEFYDMLINEVDDEIKGIGSKDTELVNFLLSRLKEDLKKVPRMKQIFEMTAKQQHLKLLEILRQKLVIRLQEKKRMNILTDMEISMFDLSKDSSNCMGSTHQPSEAMWQLIVTHPLSDVIIGKLYDVYPEEAISTFLDLLVEDRQTLLDTAKRRQRALLESIKSEVYKEIQVGKAEYNRHRSQYREWHGVLSTVEEMTYEAGNEVIQDHGIPEGKEKRLLGLIANMKEIETLVVREAHRGEALTEKIIAANTLTFTIKDDAIKDISWELKTGIERMRDEIENYRTLIEDQERKIKHLREEFAR